ncbi:MAG: hypothetical protein ABSC48_13925 [Terracidiphilus sp.]|jgi:hypothetical protein
MRRGLSLFLILFFGFGPLASALAASDESRLPPCCRRHGKHHCAMMVQMAAQAASGKPGFSAPMTCPLFPGYGVRNIASIDALPATPAWVSDIFVQSHSPASPRAAARTNPIRSRCGRSPPTMVLG